MKKSPYILIILIILLAIIGPLVYSNMVDKVPKSMEEGMTLPPDKLQQSRDAGVSMQNQGQANVNQGKNDTMLPRVPVKEYKDKGGNSTFGKDSPAGNGFQQTKKPVPKDITNKGQNNDNTSNLAPGTKSSVKSDTSAGNISSQRGTEVNVAIVGAGGKLIFGPSRVTIKEDNRWGTTALGALEATGVRYSTSSSFSSFVVNIAGKANEGMKGWMYKVNDEVPMTAASDKKLKPGDRVIWWYSEGLDKPSPTWDKL